jgi:hypothetical protein
MFWLNNGFREVFQKLIKVGALLKWLGQLQLRNKHGLADTVNLVASLKIELI